MNFSGQYNFRGLRTLEKYKERYDLDATEIIEQMEEICKRRRQQELTNLKGLFIEAACLKLKKHFSEELFLFYSGKRVSGKSFRKRDFSGDDYQIDDQRIEEIVHDNIIDIFMKNLDLDVSDFLKEITEIIAEKQFDEKFHLEKLFIDAKNWKLIKENNLDPLFDHMVKWIQPVGAATKSAAK